MASGWVLKGSIVRSSKVRRLYRKGPLDPVRVYCFLRATCDNWGMMPADKWTLKAELGPEDPHHSPEDFETAVKALAAVELVQIWEEQGSPWLYVVGHEEANGSYLKKRKGSPRVPRPDVAMLEDDSTLPEHASTLVPMEEGRGKREGEEGRGRGNEHFDIFWKEYPRKTDKAKALKAWGRINPDEELMQTIMSAIHRQKQSEQWGRGIIPHPTTWLNGKRWEDGGIQLPDDGLPRGNPHNDAVMREILRKEGEIE